MEVLIRQYTTYILPPPERLRKTFANCFRIGSPGSKGRDVTPDTDSCTIAACVVLGSLEQTKYNITLSQIVKKIKRKVTSYRMNE